ncbi:MerR family transcriptional regulator [Nocardia yunnanensis]|uniref:MerR family transcriptional regulator n=1 Tax=Nocardia yunnanensis TaxID=2382165 RepID=UPI001CA43C0D|nr:MerR family transcriptional regulator [Nocardia yunnanensis]
MSIGELARRTGVAVRTIRFYCDEGIVESSRSAGGHRMFDATKATERLLVVRRLRALGLGLESITDVLHEKRSLPEVIAIEKSRLDEELTQLVWRRAALRAVEGAAAVQRPATLALLAAAQDGATVHDCLVRFWRRVLAPLPRTASDPWVCWNVPEPPADPSVDDVLAYAELAALVADPDVTGIVRRQYWRNRPELIRDAHALYTEIGEVMVDVVSLVTEGVRPQGGRELDRFVTAHAHARGERDTPRFREQMLIDASDADHRIHRYWALTGKLLGPRVTIGQAHNWLYDALTSADDVTVETVGRTQTPVTKIVEHMF